MKKRILILIVLLGFGLTTGIILGTSWIPNIHTKNSSLKIAGDFYTLYRTTTCKNMQQSSPYDPIEETNQFTPQDEYAYVWMQLNYVYVNLSIKVLWFTPDNELYRERGPQEIPHPSTDGRSVWGWYKAGTYIYIKDYSAEEMEGDWRVDIYIDEEYGYELVAIERFTIKTITNKASFNVIPIIIIVVSLIGVLSLVIFMSTYGKRKIADLRYYKRNNKEKMKLENLEKEIFGERIEIDWLESQRKEREKIERREREEKEKKIELEKRFQIIENLIKEKNFSYAIRELNDLIDEAKSYNFTVILNKAYEKLDLCKKLEVKERASELKNRYPTIEKLIQDMKFSEATVWLKDIKNTAKSYNLSEIINWADEKLDLCNKLEQEKFKLEKIDRVKKTVLELGTKFPRLQIAEISEVCVIKDEELIINTVKEMINNKEIYAQYFSSTKSVAFNQQANIEEIDKLMKSYKEWEDKKVGKN